MTSKKRNSNKVYSSNKKTDKKGKRFMEIPEPREDSMTGIEDMMGRMRSSIKTFFRIVFKPVDWFVTLLVFIELRSYIFCAGRLPKLELLKVQDKSHTVEDGIGDNNRVLFEQEQKICKLEHDLRNAESQIKQEIGEVEKKIQHISQLEISVRTYRNRIKSLSDDLEYERNKLQKTEERLNKENEELRRRLSEYISVKLRDNNPNIADLNDQCRPTKLAEMYSELYDNEWTDAYSILTVQLPEPAAIEKLLYIIIESYEYCSTLVNKSWSYLEDWFFEASDKPSSEQQKICKWLKDNRKAVITKKVEETVQQFTKKLLEECEDENLKLAYQDADVSKYIQKCIKICLLMRATDPPVVLVYQASGPRLTGTEQVATSDPDASNGGEGNAMTVVENRDTFDRNAYKEYTVRGKYVEFIVWPPMLLHENGAMLSKGIAQGTKISSKEVPLPQTVIQTA
ncbi:hypothetical protein ACF0H5_010680 [Mactra antiquata]